MDTKEFYQLRERVGLIQSDLSHVLVGQEKQNGYIKDLADSVNELTDKLEATNKALSEELEATKQAWRPYQFALNRSGSILVAILTGVLLTVVMRILGIFGI